MVRLYFYGYTSFAAEREAEKYVGSRIMTHFLRDRGSQTANLEPESMKSVLLQLIQSRYRTNEKGVRLSRSLVHFEEYV